MVQAGLLRVCGFAFLHVVVHERECIGSVLEGTSMLEVTEVRTQALLMNELTEDAPAGQDFAFEL